MLQIVGFVVTPDEIANRVASLDAAIKALASSVSADSKIPSGSKWRQEFDAFLRRWAVERDAWATWSSRLFATRVLPRLDAFESSYRWWAADFERRTGKAPLVPGARRSEGLFELPRVPGWVWVSAVVVVGGAVWYATKK